MFKNVKDISKYFSFMREFVKIINLYADCCDDYFKSEQNQKEHEDLYNYYKNLKENILNCSKKYGVVK